MFCRDGSALASLIVLLQGSRYCCLKPGGENMNNRRKSVCVRNIPKPGGQGIRIFTVIYVRGRTSFFLFVFERVCLGFYCCSQMAIRPDATVSCLPLAESVASIFLFHTIIISDRIQSLIQREKVALSMAHRQVPMFGAIKRDIKRSSRGEKSV